MSKTKSEISTAITTNILDGNRRTSGANVRSVLVDLNDALFDNISSFTSYNPNALQRSYSIGDTTINNGVILIANAATSGTFNPTKWDELDYATIPMLDDYLLLSGGKMTGNIDMDTHDLVMVREITSDELTLSSNNNIYINGNTNITGTLIQLIGTTLDLLSFNPINISNSSFNAKIDTSLLTADRQFQLPDTAGTIALLSNIAAALADYLPLGGGTMTGQLNMGGYDLKISGVTKGLILEDRDNPDSFVRVWYSESLGLQVETV